MTQKEKDICAVLWNWLDFCRDYQEFHFWDISGDATVFDWESYEDEGQSVEEAAWDVFCHLKDILGDSVVDYLRKKGKKKKMNKVLSGLLTLAPVLVIFGLIVLGIVKHGTFMIIINILLTLALFICLTFMLSFFLYASFLVVRYVRARVLGRMG